MRRSTYRPPPQPSPTTVWRAASRIDRERDGNERGVVDGFALEAQPPSS